MPTEREVSQDRSSLPGFEGLPKYPILSIKEAIIERDENGDLKDHRIELSPELQAQLGPDDIVVHIEVLPERDPPRSKPSALREIMRLAGVPTHNFNLKEVGLHGGPVASLASIDSAGIEALRKFEILHGRDALEIALALADRFPNLLRATLTSLAETQGREQEVYQDGVPFRQEEPGRIILVDRPPDDPVGQKFSALLNWGFPFYGSIDATPTFVSAIAQYTSQHASFLDHPYTGRDGQEHTMGEAFALSTDWLINKLDGSADGLLEFKNTDMSGGGIAAQAWKDSAFAYIHADGSRANHDAGIASVEVQAFAYDALLDAATVFRNQGLPMQANDLEIRARELRQRIIKTFWIDDPIKGGYFALATDHDPETGELRTMNVRTSNMGLLLKSRLLDGDDEETIHMANCVIRQVCSEESLQKYGVGTLATDEVGFRKGGYHTGSIWPKDVANIADGIERHGHPHLAWHLREKISRTVEETGFFPELIRGGETQSVAMSQSEIYVWNKKYKVLHLLEQPPQEIQGWTVSALLAAKYRYPAYLDKVKKNELPMSPLEQSFFEQFAA